MSGYEKREYEIPEFTLDDYPVNRAGGRLTPLDAETIYYWEGKYWAAVLLVERNFGRAGPRKSVIRYRWQWKKPRDGGTERWMLDQKYTINKADLWEKEKKAINEMVSKL